MVIFHSILLAVSFYLSFRAVLYKFVSFLFVSFWWFRCSVVSGFNTCCFVLHISMFY